MIDVQGLTGLRPAQGAVARITCPPYDVIKPGTKLEAVLKGNADSLVHITLGSDPNGALTELLRGKKLQKDEEPCYYVYEQRYEGEKRIGVLAAVEVSDYSEGKIIRHEKTFDDKVKGRLALRAKTGYTFEPVFLLTKSPLTLILEKIRESSEPEYHFISDFDHASELHGIENFIYRVKADSEEGRQIKEAIGSRSLYIADGHHRYHASLLNKQTHFLAYICENAKIQAYNRVINGQKRFAEVKGELDLKEISDFATPAKHQFAIYAKGGTYLLEAKRVPDDVVGRLDCSILEKELYPYLGLTHEMVMDPKHFDYYPEADLEKMKQCVDTGKFDIAVALHPVSIEELMAVADAGIKNPNIVMPEKSTFFAPKILSGIFIYRHTCR